MAATGARRVLLALYGPTSSGKTKLSVAVARGIERDLGAQTVVISADSRQVYRHMDIGTSKTTTAQAGGIRHTMVDVTEPVRKLELEDYARLAREQVAECFAANQVAFVVGGTGVYVKALLGGWEVDRVGAARDSLRRDFPRSMSADAHAMLRRLDRDLGNRVHPNNYEAVINALAVLMSSNGSTSFAAGSGGQAAGSGGHGAGSGIQPVLLGLDPGPRTLDQRVADTYDDQVRRGLYAEVSDLADRYDLDREFRRDGRDSQNQVLHTHGYREYFEVAREVGKPVGRLDDRELREVRGRVIEHIRQYTRRQRTWFQKLPAPRMVSSAQQAMSLLQKALAPG